MTKGEKENIKRKLILWYETLDRLTPTEREIIEYRYKDGMCWEYIAKKTGYSRMQCFRIHDKVLERIREFLNKG